MKAPRAPRFEERRTADFSAELRKRAQAWIPAWDLPESQRDFGHALLEIAARFNSEVAERLDNVGEKMRRGFLDWLAVRGLAARPSRLPVVLKLAGATQEAVLALAPVQLQAEADGASVMFETEKDLRIVPGRLDVVVGVDADKDAFFLPPPGLSDLEPPEPLPIQWVLKSYASVGATKLQLDPGTGLAPEMILEVARRQYRITQVDNEIVTIDPPLEVELPQSAMVRKVTAFAPFDGAAINSQEHALYLGHMDLLNIESAGTIDVVGATALRTGVTWQYWGKVEGNDEVGWQPLTLSDDQQADAVALEKKKGSVEPLEIDGKTSRWIRAFLKAVEGTGRPLLQADTLELRINCKEGTIPCPPNSSSQEPSPVAEAMANTTPLVLDNVFFPLGKEPRQFDAFYLGSQEAFSKKGAEVQLCFEMADPTFSSLSVVREGTFANFVLAGVAKDRALHLFQANPTTGSITKFLQREPLQPPLPGYFGRVEPGNAVALDAQPRWRLPIWHEADFLGRGFLVGVSAGTAIWVWREVPGFQTSSGWIDFGRLPAGTAPASDPVDGLVHLGGAAPKLAALHNNRLYVRDLAVGSQWDEVETKDAANKRTALESIVPVLRETASGLVSSTTEGMVGVSDDNKLYTVTLAGLCTELSPVDVGIDVRPVAVRDAAGSLVVAAAKTTPGDLVMFHSVHGEAPLITLEGNPATLTGFDVVRFVPPASGSVLYFLASVQTPQGSYLASWIPHDAAGAKVQVFMAPVLPDSGAFGGSPVQVAQRIVVPGTRADVFLSEFDPTLRLTKQATIEIGVVVPDSIPALAVGDLIVRSDGNVPPAPVTRLITQAGLTQTGEVFYPIDSDFPSGTTGLDVYDVSDTLAGAFVQPNKWKLNANDLETEVDDWLLIGNKFYTVHVLNKASVPWVATISSPTGDPMPASGNYVRPITTGGRIAPFMHLDPATNGDWDAGLLSHIRLIFPDEDPGRQTAKAFSVALGNKPVMVVLGEEFQKPVNVPAEFVVDAAVGEWQRILGDTSTNPELSWEYWNGKGWWRLDITFDGTLNLKATGALRFEVPPDIASSDWAGKTNHWIRARLIGGDYGREKITTKSKTVGEVTKQTIERSSEGIRPPSVVKLHISYSVFDGVEPTFVLARDSGSMRDQSDANRTVGAQIEAFVPLALALGRLSQTGSQVSPSSDCPPDCRCHSKQVGTTDSSTGTSAPPVTPTLPTSGRALFIGLDATLSGAPVNVLLLVEHEQDHGQLLPLMVEALVADHFDPILAEDGTRAVGESGLLSMAFTVPPTRGELFGKTLTWLRLTPKAETDSTKWMPSLRGAYLNAVWATATETLTRELVGSSDGSPNLTRRLARPPVLNGTLELRVKEPLGDEERAALRKDDARRVLSDVQDLPGDWVRWTQVTDPNDESATERVYALDEATGEIRFGDGRHGMIPPIGRDSIVAFTYQRAEPPKPGSDTVPGNLIAPRTVLNLVSPVESVEGVFAADQAAGGAPPEPDDRVLQFGFARLRHRHRAVTTQDVEDVALQSSPDIAQVRCLLRRGSVRVVVVMRGKTLIPNAAQRRELHRLLTAEAPPALSAQGALHIVGPSIRRLRVGLTLRVESLDHAGALSEDIKNRLGEFFDAARGGIDQDGWRLGINPSEEDIALALIDRTHLESLIGVTLHEVVGGTEQAWPVTLKSVELAVLDDDPVRIQFKTTEVMA